MKKFILAAFLILAVSTGAYAQHSGTVQGTVTDSKTHVPLSGTVIALTRTDKPDQEPQKAIADAKGVFVIHGVPYGQYSLKASYIGYKDYFDNITVSASTTHANLQMEQGAVELQALTMTANAIRTSQKGDTVVYNADAFKTTKDADAEGLISKMPGITVTDGQVEAQGEQVQKVLVDGREFFGTDVAATIKNLPSEVIDKVEVYNSLSDQAKLTGIDDGDSYKAINIVTKKSMQTGAFGKVYAGYGTWDKYIVGGSLNFFTGKNRLSLIGLANNINQQNFSTEDILGVTSSGGGGSRYSSGRSSSRGGSYGGGSSAGNFMMPPMAGVSTVGSIGLNYSTQYKDKLDFQGSYFYNETLNHRTTITDTEYFPVRDTVRYASGAEQSDPHNYNQRLNAKLDWKINDNNLMSFRPQFSYQSNNSTTSSSTLNTRSPMDNPADTTLLNSIRRLVNSKTVGYNGSFLAVYVHKFARPGRTLSLDGTFSASTNNPTSENYNKTLYGAPADTTINKYLKNIGRSKTWGLEGNLTYTEPISSKAQLLLRYRMRYNYSDADRKTYSDWLSDDPDPNSNAFPPIGHFGPDFDPHVSNVYNSGYLVQRGGLGIRYGGTKTSLYGTIYLQHSNLDGDQTYPIEANPKIRTSYNNILYFGQLVQTFNPQNTLRVYARSSTDSPSVSQLQNYIDDRNPQSVSTGNPDLKQTVSHNILAIYNRSSITKGRTLMLMGNFSIVQNDIVDSTLQVGGKPIVIPGNNGNRDVTLQPYSRFTKPVNVGAGSWNAMASVVYGFPVNPIKSNLNLNLRYTFSKSPTFITNTDAQGNPMPALRNTQNYSIFSAGANLSSNISTNLDFSLAYNFGYSHLTNLITDSNNDNNYWNQTANLRLKWITWWDLTFTGSVFYSKYRGITSQFTDEKCLISAFVGKQIFKNKRGEINIGVNDLLNQNSNFTRTPQPQYISNVTNNVIPRYYSIQFIYNLRSFKGQGPSQNKSVVGDELEGGGHSFRHMDGPGNGAPDGQRGSGGMGGGPMIRGPR